MGYNSTQDYCDDIVDDWLSFCKLLQINYDNFYRTTSLVHKKKVLRYYNDIQQYIYRKKYSGKYCIGCESFITEKEIINGNTCPIHLTELIHTEEENQFFKLSEFGDKIQDTLVDKSRYQELKNLIKDGFDLSITRQNVDWGIKVNDEVLYVWFEALLNYAFSAGYPYDDEFEKRWEDSLIICGKDNLKFQAYILQALLLANNITQTKEVLVHGTILDADGVKMSKTIGNVIDPVEQYHKFGLDPLRYYLVFGLNTFSDSKYSESELVDKWNSEIVNGLGNLISRLLHLIDIKEVDINFDILSEDFIKRVKELNNKIDSEFNTYNLSKVNELLNITVNNLNKRITHERPFSDDCENRELILNEIYFELLSIIKYYKLILKDSSIDLDRAFKLNKKVVIFKKLDIKFV